MLQQTQSYWGAENGLYDWRDAAFNEAVISH